MPQKRKLKRYQRKRACDLSATDHLNKLADEIRRDLKSRGAYLKHSHVEGKKVKSAQVRYMAQHIVTKTRLRYAFEELGIEKGIADIGYTYQAFSGFRFCRYVTMLAYINQLNHRFIEVNGGARNLLRPGTAAEMYEEVKKHFFTLHKCVFNNTKAMFSFSENAHDERNKKDLELASGIEIRNEAYAEKVHESFLGKGLAMYVALAFASNLHQFKVCKDYVKQNRRLILRMLATHAKSKLLFDYAMELRKKRTHNSNLKKKIGAPMRVIKSMLGFTANEITMRLQTVRNLMFDVARRMRKALPLPKDILYWEPPCPLMTT